MATRQRNYLRIPRDATFPALPVPSNLQEYAHAYYVGAKELWEKNGKGNYRGVPLPDSLVFPILFLVYHYLELELKSGIELTNSIGRMTGELPKESNSWGHDLNHLLRLLQENLGKLADLPEGRPSEPTCQLIEDIAKFGVLSESLRYPLTNVSTKSREKAMGTTWPDSLIPDVAAVIGEAEKASHDFHGLIGYLVDYEDTLIDLERYHDHSAL